LPLIGKPNETTNKNLRKIKDRITKKFPDLSVIYRPDQLKVDYSADDELNASALIEIMQIIIDEGFCITWIGLEVNAVFISYDTRW